METKKKNTFSIWNIKVIINKIRICEVLVQKVFLVKIFNICKTTIFFFEKSTKTIKYFILVSVNSYVIHFLKSKNSKDFKYGIHLK